MQRLVPPTFLLPYFLLSIIFISMAKKYTLLRLLVTKSFFSFIYCIRQLILSLVQYSGINIFHNLRLFLPT